MKMLYENNHENVFNLLLLKQIITISTRDVFFLFKKLLQ